MQSRRKNTQLKKQRLRSYGMDVPVSALCIRLSICLPVHSRGFLSVSLLLYASPLSSLYTHTHPWEKSDLLLVVTLTNRSLLPLALVLDPCHLTHACTRVRRVNMIPRTESVRVFVFKRAPVPPGLEEKLMLVCRRLCVYVFMRDVVGTHHRHCLLHAVSTTLTHMHCRFHSIVLKGRNSV